jgi:hypothetical protein
MFGQSLTVIGLIIEAAGVFMIFIWGPPQPNFEWEEHDVVTAGSSRPSSKKSRYRAMSFMALVLIFAGLLFQLYDAWKWK